MTGRPRTTAQVARELGEPPFRLYHHVRTLERAGLVRLVETRPNRGTTEKYYQATAREFELGRGLSRGRRAVLNGALAAAMAGPAASVERLAIRTTRSRLARLRRRLSAWISECRRADRPDGKAEFVVTVAVERNRRVR